MAYLLLMGAILTEVFATSMLKSTEGFTKLWPTLACLAGYGVSFTLLSISINRGMQTSIAYAIWSAVGTALIVTIAVLFLGESLTAVKLLGLVLIVTGVVTLNMAGAH